MRLRLVVTFVIAAAFLWVVLGLLAPGDDPTGTATVAGDPAITTGNETTGLTDGSGAATAPTLPPATASPVATATPVATPTAAPPSATPLPPVPTPTPDPLACLSTRQRLGQILMPLVIESELPTVVEYAAAGEVAGVTLLGTPGAGLADALASLQDQALVPLHIASDEEGGVVQRLGALIRPLPSAAELATSSPEAVEELFRDYGTAMRSLGVTMAFAPVVDVGGGPGIGTRSFSTDPTVVTEFAQAVIDGYASADVVPVIKHFPGHGRASADSHLSLPVTPALDELRSLDLIPFQNLVDSAPAVMVAHLQVPGLSEDLPTSLSADAINGLLRTELGFDGLVVTDAFNMGAISATWTDAEAIVLAVSGGADLAIVSGISSVTPVLDELEQNLAANRLNRQRVDEAALNVLQSKGRADWCVGRPAAVPDP